MFYFNPLKTTNKSVVGGVSENCEVTFKVFTNANCVCMRVYSDNEHIDHLLNKMEGGFYADLKFEKGLYFYCFIADGVVYGKGDNYDCQENGSLYQLTVFNGDYRTPSWIKGSIMYQIFPDRFCKVGDFEVGFGKQKRNDWGGLPKFKDSDGKVRNNEFFGGNFAGILSKLDYLKSLNVGCIYLNPISQSYSSHRYDTGDYLTCDSVLGTNEDLKQLITTAKQKGINFVLDGVYNHTGADSKYFNKYNNYDSVGAYNSSNSPYYDWYNFNEFPNNYESWWDFDTLPSIKKDSQSFQQFIAGENGVLKRYLDMGVSGFRLDVVDELKDDFVAKIRNTLKKNGDNLLIGEVWEDATNKVAYGEQKKYFTHGELDSVMNYPLKDAIINFALSRDCSFLTNVINQQINNYPKQALDCLMNILSTHDSSRIITVLGRRNIVTDKNLMAYEVLDHFEYERGKQLVMCCSVIQFFIYGVPSVYYGDEIAMQGDLDPYNRRCFDWENGDKQMLAHYLKISKIRNECKFLSDAETSVIYSLGGLFIFERSKDEQNLIVAVNFDNHSHIIKLNDVCVDLYANKRSNVFDLQPNNFIILKGE